jgi:hypothetical protein
MSGRPWTDDELREHVLRRRGFFESPTDDDELRRAECIRQMRRIVPALQRRLLESTGATTYAAGVAILAAEAIERSNDPRRFWIVASTTPWEHLEEWIGDELVALYKKAAKKQRKDRKVLDGIVAASTRRELE